MPLAGASVGRIRPCAWPRLVGVIGQPGHARHGALLAFSFRSSTRSVPVPLRRTSGHLNPSRLRSVWHRFHQPLADAADTFLDAAGHPLPASRASRERPTEYYAWMLVLLAAMLGVFPRPRSAAVLRLLRTDADPDVFHHRHLGRARTPLCRRQVFPVHLRRFGVHAGGGRSIWA